MDLPAPNISEKTAHRWLALDALRGLSVFGMVFSAIVPSKVLPGWMYHVQNPPPTHVLDMTIPGISWVDWVFPIFIFCMGVAIPLAGWKKSENNRQFLSGVLLRFLLLWIFAYLTVLLNPSGLKGNLDLVLFDVHVRSYDIQALILLGFLAMFAVYWRLKPGVQNSWIRVAGACLMLGLIALFHWGYGASLTLHNRSIILLLLAFLYLFGSLIWYASRRRLWGRLAFFLGVIGLSFLSKETGFDKWLYAQKSLSWVFNMEQIYFLLILIPATWVGDYISGRLGWRGQKTMLAESPPVGHLFYVLLGILAVFLCVGFYHCWNEWVLLAVSLSVLLLCMVISRNSCRSLYPVIALAAGLLIAGILFDPYEGGIKKVPATFSYCFSMGGICIILLLFFHYLCSMLPGSFFVRTFSGAGANPLMSYVAFGAFVMPVFKITFLIGIYQAAYPAGEPWLGVLRAFIVVLFTMYLVSILSRKGIYWRA
ncbi:MAG: DUF5009 domain-containing protein [Bacteroidales bacterium]|nr:DUF5009 domain-containing protein [Bacteroidales bacterium]